MMGGIYEDHSVCAGLVDSNNRLRRPRTRSCDRYDSLNKTFLLTSIRQTNTDRATRTSYTLSSIFNASIRTLFTPAKSLCLSSAPPDPMSYRNVTSKSRIRAPTAQCVKRRDSTIQPRIRMGRRVLIAISLIVLSVVDVNDAFLLAPIQTAQNRAIVGSSLSVSHDLHNSWSSAGNTSRLGVRKRVRAVLAKAKSRNRKSTGTQAVSTSFYPNSKTNLVIPQTPRSPDMITVPTTTMKKNTNSADLFLFRDEDDLQIERIPTAADEPESDVETSFSLEQAKKDVPLPFVLPSLTPIQKQLLSNGERIQEQSKMGREGSGFVVLDVDAPDYVVWECLLDFEKYPGNIGTVRSMQLYDVRERPTQYDVKSPMQRPSRYGSGLETRASFILSKFRLNIAAVHTYQPHPAGHFMEFSLDKSCRNAVLKHAKGIWHTESNPDGKEGVTRVWLLCELQVSSVLPNFIVDYTAKKAMPRASNWIRPTVEAKKKEMNIY